MKNLFLILSFILFLALFSCNSSKEEIKTGKYKHIIFSQYGPIGQVPVSEINGIAYSEISLTTTGYNIKSIDEYGKLHANEVVEIKDGFINSWSYTNEWGEEYQTKKYEKISNDTLKVKMYNQAGRNTLLPASFQLLVFKNNLLYERVNMDSKNERLINNGYCAAKYEYFSGDLSFFF